MKQSKFSEESLFSKLIADIASRQMKTKGNRKGFTLVELIVVLVILGILAAILIPSLTGFIDKARQTRGLAEANEVYLAAQSAAAEQYAEYGDTVPSNSGSATDNPDNLYTKFKRNFGKRIYDYLAGDLPGIYGVFDGNWHYDYKNNKTIKDSKILPNYIEIATKFNEYFKDYPEGQTYTKNLNNFKKSGKSSAKVWFNLLQGTTSADYTVKAVWYIDSTGTYMITIMMDSTKGGPTTTYTKL